MWIIWQIVVGIVIGWLAGQIVKGRGMGLLVDLIVGIVGSILGGWIFGLLGLAAYGLIGQLVMGVIGAVVLLLLVRAIKRVLARLRGEFRRKRTRARSQETGCRSHASRTTSLVLRLCRSRPPR